jgi:hypothetical protein
MTASSRARSDATSPCAASGMTKKGEGVMWMGSMGSSAIDAWRH